MADFTGFVVDAPDIQRGVDHYAGTVLDAPDVQRGIDTNAGYLLRTMSLWWDDHDGTAQITLGALVVVSSGIVATPATTGQLSATLGALTIASTGATREFAPSRDRTTIVPSWPRILLAENPDRVIELYRPPRTVRTAA